MKREIIKSKRLKSPIQYKLKEKHAKTHINQTHKERKLKAAREKQQVTYKGNAIHLTADLSAETLQARREWQDIFKGLKGKNLQPTFFFPQGSHSKFMEKSKVFQTSKS